MIGVDPILAYACQVQVPDDTNDWDARRRPARRAGRARAAARPSTSRCPRTAEMVIEFEVDLDRTVMEGPLGEYTGYYTPAVDEAGRAPSPPSPIAASAIFQGLLTGKPATENHILKQLPFEASVCRALKRQFPTIEQRVDARRRAACRSMSSSPCSRALPARRARRSWRRMASNMRPKWVIVVDPDIDVHDSDRSRMGDGVPRPAAARRDHRRQRAGRTLDPSVDLTRDAHHAHRLDDRHRCDAAVRRALLRGCRRPRLAGFRDAGARPGMTSRGH